jgi:CAAX protease family protein
MASLSGADIFGEELNRMTQQELSSLNLPHRLTWQWRDLFWIVLGIFGVGIIALLAMGILLYVFDQRDFIQGLMAQSNVSASLAMASVEVIALVVGVYLFGLRRKKYNWSVVGLRSSSWIWILVSIFGTVIAIPLTAAATLLLMLALKMPLENPQIDFLAPQGINLQSGFLMLLLAGVAAPFAEELFFRGFLYSFFRERWGIFPSVLLSSLIFAVLHGNLLVGFTAFLLAILLALVFEYSRSLWPAVIIHAINNTFRIALLYALIYYGVSI